jgi:hypothetical protein
MLVANSRLATNNGPAVAWRKQRGAATAGAAKVLSAAAASVAGGGWNGLSQSAKEISAKADDLLRKLMAKLALARLTGAWLTPMACINRRGIVAS